MKNQFAVKVRDIDFRFHTMNVKKLQLFQVYFTIDGAEKRFHMQLDKSGVFKITDAFHIPQHIAQYEVELSEVILSSAQQDGLSE